MKRHILAASALVVAAFAAVSAQGGQPPSAPDRRQAPPQPPVTFRAEVNYVEVDARVVDAQGRLVPGLAQADFEVLEDGKPQNVTVFSFVNIPVERAERPLFANRPIEPDVQSNIGHDGRVYVIVLDDTHTNVFGSQRVKAAARQFVERYFGVNDVAAVVTTSGRKEGAQEFTSNPRLLLQAIDSFMGRKLRSALLERIEEEARTRDLRSPGDPIRDPSEMERSYHARNTLTTIKNIAQMMEGVRGRRKALVFFSEGIDYNINDPFENREATTIIDSTREAIAAATRANVAIYGIDVRGLSDAGDVGIEIQSFPEDPTLGLNSSALLDEFRRGQDSLRVLSDETGGVAAVNNNNLASAFQRLVDDNSSYYVLGYYSTNDRRDGRFRRIDVRVKKPGLQVRARRGYVAPRGRAPENKLSGPEEASAELREAISSPLPVGALALEATAAVFKGPAPNGSVVVSTIIVGRDLPLTESGGQFKNDLEIAVIASNAEGKVFPGERNVINLNLKPDTVPRVRAGGFRIITALELPPGRYQLRIAAREANTKRAGSMTYDVEVPDFSKAPLSMSGLALTSISSTFAPTARPKDPLAKILPGPLTTYREFPQNDEVAVFAEVYDTALKQAHKVGIALTVKAEGGQTVFQTREERDSSELSGKSGGYGFTARVPLRDFAPGLYVLTVEAQAQIGERETTSRDVVFRVVPGVPVTTRDSQAPAPATPARPGAPATPGAGTPPAAPAPRPAAPPAQQPVAAPLTNVAADMMSAIDSPRTVVARTAAEFEALWRQHAPGRPAPAVDLAKNMVVAVFLGSRPSGGYSVQITSAAREGNVLVVRWAERRPGPGQMAAQVMTAPSHMVQVPRHDGDVRFEKVEPPPGD